MDDTVPTTSNMSDCTLPPRVEKPPPQKVCKHRGLSWTSCFAKHNNATLQPVFKFKTETTRMMLALHGIAIVWSSGIGAWVPMIFNPFQSHNHLKRHFAMRSSSHIRCQATAFSLCPLAVSLHSRFLRCRLKIPGCDWLVPVWTAQYGNKM